MNKLKSLLPLALFMAGCSSNTIYVNPRGNDDHRGSSLFPVASIDRALQLIEGKEGSCTVRLSEGTFCISSPIVIGNGISDVDFVGEGTGKTIVSSGLVLPHFSCVNDTLWSVDLTRTVIPRGEIQQLFVNGRRAPRASTPFFPTGKVEETVFGGYAVQEISIPDDAVEELEKTFVHGKSRIIIEVCHAWDMTRRYIESFDPDSKSVYVSGSKMHPWNTLDKVSHFRLVDDIAFVDEPGEWFHDISQNRLYYYPLPDEDITLSSAVIPCSERLLDMKGDICSPVTNLTFEGISFLYTRFTMARGGDSPQQGGGDTDAAIMVDHASGIHFHDCGIAHTGKNGIWFRENCSECSVSECYIHDLGAGAVKIGTLRTPQDSTLLTNHITIDNNVLRDGGHEFPQGIGAMIFNASDNAVTHNEISDFYYTGISVGWSWGYACSPTKRNDISYNHIHHLGKERLSDMGGIYTLGLSEGTVLRGNVISHISSLGYGGWGIYTDEGSTGILVENNLVHHCKCSSFHQHYGSFNVIRNNIFADGQLAQMEATRIEDHLSFTFCGNIISYNQGDMYGNHWDGATSKVYGNLYWKEGGEVSFNGLSLSEWQKKTGKDSASVIMDPVFRDPSSMDYTPTCTEAMEKIGFTPFDFTTAGVYGAACTTLMLNR